MTNMVRILVALLPAALYASAQSPAINALKTKVRDLHARSADVRLTLTDATELRGRILRLGEDAFTFQQKKPSQEIVVRYAQLKEARKAGLSRRAKAIIIPAAIGGSVLLVLCAAPYPIGYLCRKDPS
jgi:hypothetical protein